MKNVLFFTAAGMETAKPLLWEGRWDECSCAKIKDALIKNKKKNVAINGNYVLDTDM